MDDVAICCAQRSAPFQKGHIIIMRDETDLLAVTLFRDRQVEFTRQTAHLILAADRSERKYDPTQLLLGQGVEEI